MVKFEDFQKLSSREKKKVIAELHQMKGATFQIYKDKPINHAHRKLNPKHNFGICSVPKYFI